jgi:hypothetical protein
MEVWAILEKNEQLSLVSKSNECEAKRLHLEFKCMGFKHASLSLIKVPKETQCVDKHVGMSCTRVYTYQSIPTKHYADHNLYGKKNVVYYHQTYNSLEMLKDPESVERVWAPDTPATPPTYGSTGCNKTKVVNNFSCLFNTPVLLVEIIPTREKNYRFRAELS